jgi:hypothetical protein
VIGTGGGPQWGAMAASTVMFPTALMSSGGGWRWQPTVVAPGIREVVRCDGRMDKKPGKGAAHRRAAMAVALWPNPMGSVELR